MTDLHACRCVVPQIDSGCPWHGRRPYMACSDCNYVRHCCGGCGEPLEHGEWACLECKADLMSSAGLGRGSAGLGRGQLQPMESPQGLPGTPMGPIYPGVPPP